MAHYRMATGAGLVAALVLPGGPVAAQDSSGATPSANVHPPVVGDTTAKSVSSTSTTALPSCDGKVVSAIDIRPQPPYSHHYPGVLGELERLATGFHAVTRTHVIRPFLALKVGDVCTELRRTESERILRTQPYLAASRVTAYDDGKGGIRLDVLTVDEISLIGGLAARTASPFVTFARVGDSNLGGQGLLTSAEWRDGFFYRDHFAAQITDYSVLGHPWIFNILGSRDELGGGWSATMIHPFFSDLQRFAWIGAIGEVRTFVRFLRPDSAHALALDFSRHYSDVGGLVRVGPFGRDLLFGATLSEEREESGSTPVIVTDSGVRVDRDSALIDRYTQHHVARVNAIAGIRDIRFLRVRGFDALEGEQDLPTGIQFGVLFGRSVSGLGSTENDIFVGSGMYVGLASPRTFLGLEVRSEGREDLGTDRWDGLLTSARLAAYWKPASAHTLIASTEFGLGLRQRLPFQLALGDVDGGVRGFLGSHVAGGERVVQRLEERWAMGEFRGLAAVGVAAFTDVGRMWAQGVPFGQNSSTAVGVGFSLLAAVPPQSKRLLRVDFAIPATPDKFARFEIRFSTSSNARTFYVEPRDLARGRERTVPTSIFTYPQL
jgi:hypothetical protein